ncbi:hypothetical protein PMAYCL1PPCAC_09038 [Pristionchus mayeri]|uniref:SHSP domain-containing protein n=1 Tax=Pristionchus mayeri TaxID=1317129 RepID=A0AAN4ZCW1_9BILA|nr:hypothetical protein PMAYCL1PPCAC_09038 [Pristionchus mayeri]
MSVTVEPGFWDWPLQANDGIVKVHNDDDLFHVELDAQQFTPAEIQVKVIGRILDIHCEHKNRPDSLGSVSRSIKRSYKLPDDVDAKSVTSSISPRGILAIKAMKNPK